MLIIGSSAFLTLFLLGLSLFLTTELRVARFSENLTPQTLASALLATLSFIAVMTMMQKQGLSDHSTPLEDDYIITFPEALFSVTVWLLTSLLLYILDCVAKLAKKDFQYFNQQSHILLKDRKQTYG